MKRSEMVGILGMYLMLNEEVYDNLDSYDDIASDIIKIIEKEGMLPPTYKDWMSSEEEIKMERSLRHWGFEWESEDDSE